MLVMNPPSTMVSYIKKLSKDTIENIDFRSLWSLVITDSIKTMYDSDYKIIPSRCITYYKMIYDENLEKDLYPDMLDEMTTLIHFTIQEMLARYYQIFHKQQEFFVQEGSLYLINCRER